MAFLRNLLAAILGSLIAFGLLFFIFLFFISLAGADQSVVVHRNSVLELQFPYPVSEYSGTDPDDPFAVFYDPTLGLDEITKAISLAKQDDHIAGISLAGPYVLAGMSQTRAIRNALEDFKASGKFVYAYGDFYMQKDYYLSSVADSVFMNPAGSFDFKGLAAEVLYFGDFQEQTGLKMEVVRHGKYKSAVEPFLGNAMSPENREQISVLLESVWASMRADMAGSRNLTEEALDRMATTMEARTPEKAVALGLLDGTAYRDQYDEKLLRATGDDGDAPRTVTLQDYIRASKTKRVYQGPDRIAVIYAQGEILYGEGGPQYIGQGKMVSALEKAASDEKVKAIVLRINSPGGSALSSEIIWRAIRQAREEKPVVVSLSDVAASGGYYMAVGADRIVTEPTTITGSIGVFMTLPNIGGLTEKLGISAEQVGTHPLSLDYSLFEPLSPEFREVLREGIEDTYQTFLERVSEGRNISVAQADSLAQGRVWTGQQAVELGLADTLGGMPEAIALAADMGGTENFRLVTYPKYKSGLERLMNDLNASGGEVSSRLLERELGEEWVELLRQIKAQTRQEGVQARQPFILRIR
ncbi:signal peptide peptidase SppA [Robiginitalea sp. M366]|uniref:signal peptide peptidase SppA n=1 Tax=Robiginitalea aestuariiviva TaxID=3036903 RepID=UPI00240D2E66|nr:signal peptide peptidase SppA [Robiginitalea aestuariiviva]MDG1570957.1 signal peptide peptidase SppA [Robiginitalea aestuariiviva]